MRGVKTLGVLLTPAAANEASDRLKPAENDTVEQFVTEVIDHMDVDGASSSLRPQTLPCRPLTCRAHDRAPVLSPLHSASTVIAQSHALNARGLML